MSLQRWTVYRSQLAHHARHNPETPPPADLVSAYRASRLAAAIEATTTAWPPLLDEHRDELVDRLRGEGPQ